MQFNNKELLSLISEILEYTEDPTPTPTPTPETPTGTTTECNCDTLGCGGDVSGCPDGPYEMEYCTCPDGTIVGCPKCAPPTPTGTGTTTECNCDTLGCGGDVSGCPDGPWDLDYCICPDGSTIGCPKCIPPTPTPSCNCANGVPCSSCGANQTCVNGSVGFCPDGSQIACGDCVNITPSPSSTSTSTETPTPTPTETLTICPCNCNSINFNSLGACEDWLPPNSSYTCSNSPCRGSNCETNNECASANPGTPSPTQSLTPTPSPSCPSCSDYYQVCSSNNDCGGASPGFLCAVCRDQLPFQAACSDGSLITLNCKACGDCPSSCGTSCFSDPGACNLYQQALGYGYCSPSNSFNTCCNAFEPCSCWFGGTSTPTSTSTPTPTITNTCKCEESGGGNCFTQCTDCEKIFASCTGGIPNPSCPGSGVTCCCASTGTPTPTSPPTPTPTSTPTRSCCPPDCCKNANLCDNACGGNLCCSCSSSSLDVPDPCNGSCPKTKCYSGTLVGRNLYRATCCVRLPGQVNPTYYPCCTAGEAASNCNGYRPGVPVSESFSC